MNDTIVIFSDKGTRVMHGVDARDYRNRTDVAVNPVIPAGVPPHEWKLVDGSIVVPSPVVEEPPQKPSLFKRLKSFFSR